MGAAFYLLFGYRVFVGRDVPFRYFTKASFYRIAVASLYVSYLLSYENLFGTVYCEFLTAGDNYSDCVDRNYVFYNDKSVEERVEDLYCSGDVI